MKGLTAPASVAGNRSAKSGLKRFRMWATASSASPSLSANRRSMPERSDVAIVVALTVFVAAIDQLTKFFVVSNIARGWRASKFEILHGWLALEYTENRGAAFGLL